MPRDFSDQPWCWTKIAPTSFKPRRHGVSVQVEYDTTMQTNVIYTIGYGARSASEMIALLKRYEIGFVIDIRSFPYSRFKPEFSRDPLEKTLKEFGFRYVFMGNLLGGRPQDERCYRDGKVDYAQVQETEAFRQGIERIRNAWTQQLRVCLMCSEGRPEDCHRSKLIGRVLDDNGISVRHITLDGGLWTQEEVIHAVTGGQQDLFGDTFTSRKTYAARSHDSTSGIEVE